MNSFEYEVVLSFAGENRAYVEEVAQHLKNAGIDVFYDAHEVVNLWGEDLAVRLDEVYRKESRFAVPFISRHFAEKAWPRLEFRSALARAVEEKGAYILPVRFDDTELPGLRSTIGYIDAGKTSPQQLAQMILQKLGKTAVGAAAPAAPVLLPKVTPPDFNPYAEAERIFGHLRKELTTRSQLLLARGFVTSVRDREGRFQLRVMFQGTPVYALDIWLGDESFGDNAIGFWDGTTAPSRGSSTATGKVEWDSQRGIPILKVLNFSLLPQMAGEYRLSAEELVDAIWEEACRRIELNSR